MDSQLTDDALIEQIQAGDESALRILYDRYSRLVFSLALRISGDRGTAEEITLDVFERVWRKADGYRPERGALSTWITAMTRYRAIDYHRRQQARPQAMEAPLEEARFLHGDTPGNRRRPERATARDLRRKRVREALAQLPPEQQQVLALAYFQGFSHQEMADLLELPLGTVKTRLRLALKKLRFDLRDEAPDA